MTATRITGAAYGPGTFTVPASDGDGAYTLAYQREDLCWCPCPGYANHGDCRHVRAVRDAVDEERRALRPKLDCDEITALFDR